MISATNTTTPTRASDINHEWYEINVNGQTLGRVATRIAAHLMGKTKPYYVRHLDCGDYVVVTNAQGVKVTGKKYTDKIYTSYSGYPGGIQQEAFKDLLERKPESIIRRAVYGMLPKNKLRDQLIKRLYVYSGGEHPHKEKVKNQNSKIN